MDRPKYPKLTPYDRATLGLWAHSHAEWANEPRKTCLAEVAVHVVLAHLRRCESPEGLFELYDSRLGADFALIGSLLTELKIPDDELLWRLRETAFYLRWAELTGGK